MINDDDEDEKPSLGNGSKSVTAQPRYNGIKALNLFIKKSQNQMEKKRKKLSSPWVLQVLHHRHITSSKSQVVGLFVIIAMVLRRKPDVLISVLPTLNERPKYHGQEKLPLIVWLVAQASQGDLAVGLYLWSHLILPIVRTKSCSNPQTRDLILQLVERFQI